MLPPPAGRRFPGREAPRCTSGRRLTTVSVTGPAPAGLAVCSGAGARSGPSPSWILACDAETTPRYVSFVETGRAQPSGRWWSGSRVLDVPLRERTSCSPRLCAVLRRAAQHPAAQAGRAGAHVDARPAWSRSRPWCSTAAGRCKRANTGAQRLFGRLFAPHPVPAPANVLRLVIEPGPMLATSCVTGPRWCPRFLTGRTGRRSAACSTGDTGRAVRDLRGRPDVARLLTEPDLSPGSAPIVDLHFDMAGTDLRFFSVVSTIGAPIDVTAQEFRVEAFSPPTTRPGTAGRRSKPASGRLSLNHSHWRLRGDMAGCPAVSPPPWSGIR